MDKTAADERLVTDKVVKAKVACVLDDPFFATLLLHAGLHKRDDIDTMATDGDHIYYSPKFVLDHTVPEIKAGIVHEVFHCIFGDMDRQGDRDMNAWNYACDVRINQIMDDTKRSGGQQAYQLPGWVIRNKGLYDAGKGVAEAIYDLLPRDQGGGGGKGQNNTPQFGQKYQPGQGASDLLPPKKPMTKQETQARQQEWKVRVAQAANSAKIQGKLPAHIERLIGEVLEPVIDWRQALRQYLGARARVEWSYANPRYTLLELGIILPTLSGEKLGRVWVACDVSGSISDRQKDEFAAELRAIWGDLQPDSLDVVFFSHHVTGHDHMDKGEEFIWNARGGGGTAIQGVFDLIDESVDQPEVLIVLTDLYIGDIPDVPPGFDVLWVCNQKDMKAPWGETIFLDVAKHYEKKAA